MEASKEVTKRYYDPELVSLLLTAVAALGSVAAVVEGTLHVIEYNKSKQAEKDTKEKKSQCQYSIQKEVRYALYSLLFSVENIEFGLRILRELYDNSQGVRQDSPTQFKFGNGSMWLERYQLDRFYRTQGRIIDEARNIYSNLKLVEELFLTGENESPMRDLGYNVKMRHMIERDIFPVNSLISKFGHISIEDFISESIRVCHQTRRLVSYLEDNLDRNYM